MQNNFTNINKKLWSEVIKKWYPKNSNVKQYICAKKLAVKFMDAEFLPTKEVETLFDNIIGHTEKVNLEKAIKLVKNNLFQ